MKFRPLFKTTPLVLLMVSGLVLTGCASEPKVDESPDAVNEQGLSPVTGDNVKESFVKLGTDFSKYSAYLFTHLDVEDTVVRYNPSSSDVRGRKWELDDSDREGFKAVYAKSMVDALTSRGHEVVTQSGDNVMLVSASLLKLEPKGPKDDNKNRYHNGEFYSEGAGKITIAMEFRDSVSGELLATIVDRRKAGATWQANNAMRNRMEVERLFKRWANLFASGLDEVKAKQ